MSSTNQTLLPGFGRPLNYVPQKDDPDYVADLFPSALSIRGILDGSVYLPLLTLREIAMLHFMNGITDKPDWHIKVNNEEIVQKWTEEILASGRDFTPTMVKWCIEELRHKASDGPSPVVVYNGFVVKSDAALPAEFKKELQDAVKEIESKIPERLKDWHPNSDSKVWDLVHPSLFPLIYGCSRILENGNKTSLEDCIRRTGEGTVVPVPSDDETKEFNEEPSGYYNYSRRNAKPPYSSKFQWLPCEVDISAEESKITSYINNLHSEEEKPLYNLVSRLIDASIPLWNKTLAPLSDTNVDPFIYERRINYENVEYEAEDENNVPEQEPGENEDDYEERLEQWHEEHRRVVLPEPNEDFEPLPEPKIFDLKETYAQRGLQVIVKLANIELTPEKPEYAGGSWHVEGQMNEHIVATSIYYYSNSNITSSTLSFRQQADPTYAEETGYEQQHHAWLDQVYGCHQEGPSTQDVGGIDTREGRLLTFPNILQHRVGSFKLEDPTKPGHRKMVALFLVDPNMKIISTANIPCQQQDWWWTETYSQADKDSTALNKSGVANLPVELQDHVLDDVDFPLSLEKARALRLELMEERKEFDINQGSAFESITISLCEH